MRSCYGCYFEVNDKCNWFSVYQDEAPKAIPLETIDRGCSKYKNTEMSTLKEYSYIIDVFNGEIISDKYKKPKYKSKWTNSLDK